MNKRWAALGVSLGVVGGGAAGFIATSGSSVGAESVAARSAVPAATDAGSEGQPDRSDRLAEILAPLVADNTITQAQADAVIAALEKAGPFGTGKMGGGRGHGPFGGELGGQLDSIVGTLGLTLDEVLAGLRDGKTIADLAAEQGVAVEKVIDAAVAAVKAHLDDEVASGEHTQAEADQILARATEAITGFVNGDSAFPMGGMGPMGGRGHRGGPFGHHGDAPEASATSTTVG